MRIENNVDPAGVFIFRQHFGPRLSGVDRFEDASPVRRVTADGGFARTGVNHVVVRWRDRDRANRGNRLFVEKRNPVCAAICRLPNSTRDCPKIISVWLAGDAFNRECTAAAKRTDLSPTHSIKQLLIDCSRRRWGRGCSGLKRRRKKQYRKSENEVNQFKRTVIRRNHPPTVKSLRFRSTGIALTVAILSECYHCARESDCG